MPTYRIRKVPSPRGEAKRGRGYLTSLEVLEEDSATVLATCSFRGRASLATLEIVARDGSVWTVKPSRRVMPTSWTILSSTRTVLRLQVSFWRSLINPLNRALVIVIAPSEEELFRVSDQRPGRADRLLGAGPIEWKFMKGGASIGTLRPLPKPASDRVGPVRRLFSGLGYDIGIESDGGEHVLAAPAALALAAIHAELTDPS